MANGKTVERRDAARDSYLELIRTFPLRPIRNRNELNAAVDVIDTLLDKKSLDSGESDYLDVLGDLVARYESEKLPLGRPTDAALLAHLLEAQNLTQSEAARRTHIASSTISAVLSQKRKLTRDQIERLAACFHVAPSVFFDGIANE